MLRRPIADDLNKAHYISSGPGVGCLYRATSSRRTVFRTRIPYYSEHYQ